MEFKTDCLAPIYKCNLCGITLNEQDFVEHNKVEPPVEIPRGLVFKMRNYPRVIDYVIGKSSEQADFNHDNSYFCMSVFPKGKFFRPYTMSAKRFLPSLRKDYEIREDIVPHSLLAKREFEHFLERYRHLLTRLKGNPCLDRMLAPEQLIRTHETIDEMMAREFHFRRYVPSFTVMKIE